MVFVLIYIIIVWERYRVVVIFFKVKLILKSIIIFVIIMWVVVYFGIGLFIVLFLDVIKIYGKIFCLVFFGFDIFW